MRYLLLFSVLYWFWYTSVALPTIAYTSSKYVSISFSQQFNNFYHGHANHHGRHHHHGHHVGACTAARTRLYDRKRSNIDQQDESTTAVVPTLPSDPAEMIRQAASAIRAAKTGTDTKSKQQQSIEEVNEDIHRQVIRLPLSDSMYISKEESFVADRAIGWQGGPQETYRFLSPMVRELLQRPLATNTTAAMSSGLTPKLDEQILLDFDGSALWNAQSPMGALFDVVALVQPNTDDYFAKLINQLEETFSDTPNKDKRLFVLVNPAWRDDDDGAAFGFFSRAQAKKQIIDRYTTTYALDQFIIKGNKISLLKVWLYDWCVYWTPLSSPGTREDIETDNDKINQPQLLGTFPNRPEYQETEKLLLGRLDMNELS